MPQTAERYVELDALRGLMALWVFVHHVALFAGLTRGSLGILLEGKVPVTVFIVISGFAIASSLMGSRSGYRQYLARRAVRLYPVAVTGVILGLSTYWMLLPFAVHVGWLAPDWVASIERTTAGTATHLWQHVLLHLTLLHGAVPDTVLAGATVALNGPMWSLSLEWQFYLVAPTILSVLLLSPERRGHLAALIVLTACFAFLDRNAFSTQPSFLPYMLGWFILGMITAVALRARRLRRSDVLLIAMVLATLVLSAPGWATLLPLALWGVTVTSLSGSLPRPLDGWGWLLRSPRLIWFGERSYAFYIFHWPVLLAWNWGLMRAGFAQDQIALAVLSALSLPLVLAMSWASYRYMEAPLNDWARAYFVNDGGRAFQFSLGSARLKPVARN